MLGNGIKQTTATTGTGNLTLSSVAGYPKVSDVVPIDFIVAYSLLDSNGLLLEEGLGRLSDATTFVRALVTATYSSGVYTGGAAAGSNPTAVSLTGTTTLIVTPNAATVESMLPTVDKVSASINRVVSPANRNLSTSTLAVTALRCYYTPFLLRTASQVANLQFNVSTAGAASTAARGGIYSVLENGYMGNLLATTGDQDVSTTGLKAGTLSSPISLPPGWYYAAFVSSGAPTVTAFASAVGNSLGGHPLGAVSGGLGQIEYRYETLASAVFPTTASSTTTLSQLASGNIPAVYMGLA